MDKTMSSSVLSGRATEPRNRFPLSLVALRRGRAVEP